MQRDIKKRRESHRKWRLANLEKLKDYGREYRKAHMAEILERNRLYKQSRPEWAKRVNRKATIKWRAKLTPERRAELGEKLKQYRHAHPEIYRRSARKARHETKVLEYLCRQLINVGAHLGELLAPGTPGTLIRPTVCSECGQGGKIYGHHTDYTKPLEVVWLCVKCHIKAHNGSFYPPQTTSNARTS